MTVLPDGVRGRVLLADNLEVLRGLPDGSVDLFCIDPPFNTGERQTAERIRTIRDDVAGDRTGFGGRRYRTIRLSRRTYLDIHDDYLEALAPRFEEIHRVLAVTGSLYVHLDARESHYVKVLLDSIFGRDRFLNEIVWAYDYGARTTRRWPPKHDTILVYVKHPARYWFDTAAVDRIPYLAPELVGAEKAGRGKLPTDTWWHTIVPPGGRERTGYPNQKPMGIVRRIVAASSPPDGLVVDVYAGSGTTGEAAHELGRRFLLVDDNPEAIAVMAERFAALDGIELPAGANVVGSETSR
jgi:site-specific DNA-methyltransferase (adenine-specific)